MNVNQVGFVAFDRLLQLFGCTEKPYNPPPRDVLFDVAWGHALEQHYNITSDALLDSDEARWRIGGRLTKSGLRYLEHEAPKSGFAMAMEITNNQVLRIVKLSKEARRLDIPQILQPTVVLGNWDGYHIEVLPRVNTKDVTLEHIEGLVTALAHQGYIFWDAKPENVGLLEDGTPVVLDAGATVPMHCMHQPLLLQGAPTDSHLVHFGKEMKRTYDRLDGGLSLDYDMERHPETYFNELKERPMPGYHWEGAQQKHIQSLELKQGEIAGVFSDQDVKALRKVMGGKSGVIIRGILDGVNRHDLGELSEKALKRFQENGEQEGKEWRDYLAEELADFKRTLAPQGVKNQGSGRFW